jgi:hypothetical protein
MTVSTADLIVPGHGTIFYAPAHAKLPALVSSFTLTGDAIASQTTSATWTNLGHTSTDNTFAMTVDGGDETTINSWLADAVKTTHAIVTRGATCSAVQMDKTTLQLIYNGGDTTAATDQGTDPIGVPVGGKRTANKAIFVLMTDSSGAKFGVYAPNVDITDGDAPSVNTSQLFAVPMSFTFLAETDTTVLNPLGDGTSPNFAFITPEDFALTASSGS